MCEEASGCLLRMLRLQFSAALQVVCDHVAPPLQAVFGSAALAPAEAAVALALGPLLLVAVEICKRAVARRVGGART